MPVSRPASTAAAREPLSLSGSGETDRPRPAGLSGALSRVVNTAANLFRRAQQADGPTAAGCDNNSLYDDNSPEEALVRGRYLHRLTQNPGISESLYPPLKGSVWTRLFVGAGLLSGGNTAGHNADHYSGAPKNTATGVPGSVNISPSDMSPSGEMRVTHPGQAGVNIPHVWLDTPCDTVNASPGRTDTTPQPPASPASASFHSVHSQTEAGPAWTLLPGVQASEFLPVPSETQHAMDAMLAMARAYDTPVFSPVVMEQRVDRAVVALQQAPLPPGPYRKGVVSEVVNAVSVTDHPQVKSKLLKLLARLLTHADMEVLAPALPGQACQVSGRERQHIDSFMRDVRYVGGQDRFAGDASLIAVTKENAYGQSAAMHREACQSVLGIPSAACLKGLIGYDSLGRWQENYRPFFETLVQAEQAGGFKFGIDQKERLQNLSDALTQLLTQPTASGHYVSLHGRPGYTLMAFLAYTRAERDLATSLLPVLNEDITAHALTDLCPGPETYTEQAQHCARDTLKNVLYAGERPGMPGTENTEIAIFDAIQVLAVSPQSLLGLPDSASFEVYLTDISGESLHPEDKDFLALLSREEERAGSLSASEKNQALETLYQAVSQRLVRPAEPDKTGLPDLSRGRGKAYIALAALLQVRLADAKNSGITPEQGNSKQTDYPTTDYSEQFQTELYEELNDATRETIKSKWAEDNFLIDYLERHERTVQDQLLEEQAKSDPDKDVINLLSAKLEKISQAKKLMITSASFAKKAEAFNMVFLNAITPFDISIQNIRNNTFTLEDMDLIYNKAYPVPGNIAGLLDHSLSKIFHDHKEFILTPDSNVTYSTFEHSRNDHGLHEKDVKRDSLLRLALGFLNTDSNHIEVKNLPPTISELYYKPRYFDFKKFTFTPFNFPVTEVLTGDVNSCISKLREPDAVHARHVLWTGKITKAIADYFDKHPQKHELINAFNNDPSVYTLEFNTGAGSTGLNNIIAIKESDEKYTVIDVISQKSYIISTRSEDGQKNQQTLREVVLKNIDLKNAFYARKDLNMDYMFANQKSRYETRYPSASFGMNDVTMFINYGELSFAGGKKTIFQAADILEEQEIKTLEKNAGFLTITESEAADIFYTEFIQDVLRTYGIAAGIPVLGWTPALIGAGLALGAPVAGYLMRTKTAKDEIDLAEARTLFYEELYELTKYGILAAGGGIAFNKISAVVKSHKPPVNQLKSVIANKDLAARELIMKSPVPDEILSGRPPKRMRTENADEGIPVRRLTDDNMPLLPVKVGDSDYVLTISPKPQEVFLGQNTQFKVVQQSRTNGVMYQSGYIVIGDVQIHGICTAQSTLENNGATILLIHGHASHIFNRQNLPEKIAYAPSGLTLEFAASYGRVLKNSGIERLHENAARVVPREIIKSGPFTVVRDKPDVNAQKLTDFAWSDATGLKPTSGTAPDSGLVPYHDLMLGSLDKDPQALTHFALPKQFTGSITDRADILLVRPGHKISLSDILKQLPLEKKYDRITIVGCRMLRGCSKNNIDIPVDQKNKLFNRLSPEIGLPLSELHDLQRQYVEYRMKNPPLEHLTAYEYVLSQDILFKPRSRRAVDDASGEPEQGKNEFYYFFNLTGIITRTDISSVDHRMSETVLGYIISDASSTIYFLPVNTNAIIQPAA